MERRLDISSDDVGRPFKRFSNWHQNRAERPQRSRRLPETPPRLIRDDTAGLDLKNLTAALVFLYSLLLFGSDAFKLPRIRRCLRHLSWLPSRRGAPADIRPRGGSDPRSVWSLKGKTPVYKLSLFYALSIRFYGKHLNSRYPKQRLLRQHSQPLI